MRGEHFYDDISRFYYERSIHLFIYLFIHSQKSYKNLIYIYTYTLTHRHTVYSIRICMCTVHPYARVHTYIIKSISIAVLGENRTCRRLRVLSSSPENILK